MTARPGLLMIGVLLLLGACNGGGGPSPVTPTPGGETPTATPEASATPTGAASPAASPTAAPGASPTATPTQAPPPFEGTRGPVEGKGSVLGPEGALLVQVRLGRHEGFDRIVFQFEGGTPSYRVEYVEPPILAEFSGLEVPIEGNAFLRVRCTSAAAHDPSTGDSTYMGPRELVSGFPALLESEETGDFEGSLTWVLGLSEQVDFRVITLEEPFRVAVDVAHP